MSEPTQPTPAPSRSASGYDLTRPDEAQFAQLVSRLTPEEQYILLHQGTERPGCGGLLYNKKPGVYKCRLCGLPLFSSKAKFDSGTGWPSFYEPFDPDHIRYLRDFSHGMIRVEIRCRRCDGHLGHVFEDGPEPTGLRYCLNSASLEFTEQLEPPEPTTASNA